jgi:hypothetical protein
MHVWLGARLKEGNEGLWALPDDAHCELDYLDTHTYNLKKNIHG